MQALLVFGGDASIKYRDGVTNNKWYVALPGVGVSNGRTESGKSSVGGNTVEEAVTAGFAALTQLKEDEHVVTRNSGVTRRLRWNGFMWKDIPEEVK